MLLFPYDTLVFAESEIPDESFLVTIAFLVILGYPFSEGKFGVKNGFVWLGPPVYTSAKNAVYLQ